MRQRRPTAVHPSRRIVCVAALVAAASLAAAAPAPADPAAVGMTISSPGPLKKIYISNRLQCQVRRGGWGGNERAFRPQTGNAYNGSCGTFLAPNRPGGATFGPQVPIPGATFATTVTPFTPVSQVLFGSGVVTCIRTVVEAAGASMFLTEIDCYRVGDSFYSTSLEVSNTTALTALATLFHVGDCWLHNSNSGRGKVLSGKRVFCTRNSSPNNTTASNSIGFIPTDSNGAYPLLNTGPVKVAYIEGKPPAVWGLVNTSPYFQDTCVCNTMLHNNAIGLSAQFKVPPNGSMTVYGRTSL